MRLILSALLLLATPLLADEPIRTELTRAAVPGSETHEVIVSRLEIPPGATIPRHFHHGDEHLVVVEGGEMTTADGSLLPFPAGASALFPALVAHGGLTNNGETAMVAITTHVVEKGKPLNVPVE